LSAPILWLTGWSADPSCIPFHTRTSHLYSVDFTSASFADDFKRLTSNSLFQISGRVTLAGWSLGAMVCLDVALTHPEKIDRMILFAPTARFTITKNYTCAWPRHVLEKMRDRLRQNPAQVLKNFYTRMLSPTDALAGPLDYPMWKKDLWPLEALCAGLDYLITTDLRERLRDITLPTLILHGTDDNIIPLQTGRMVAENLQTATLLPVKDGGHLPFLSQKSIVDRICQEFMS
jgi:pimeloyl-[acyl-carrier protein] methyl ester esterase